MTLKEIINIVDESKTNIITPGVKARWISKIDGQVCSEVMKKFRQHEVSLIKDTAIYSLHLDIKSYDVVKVLRNTLAIDKIDERSLEVTGYYFTSNEDDTENIVIYPAPSTDDEVLTIVYQLRNPKYKVDDDITLLIPEPYDTIYEHYLTAMIDKANEDYEGYTNNMLLFNTEFKAFERWYKQRQPMTSNRIKNYW